MWSCDQIGPVTLTRAHQAQRGPFSALGLADFTWRVCRSVEQRLASRRDDVGRLRRRCTGLLKLDAPDEVVQPTGPVGRAWARHPVTRPVQPRYEWLYLYAFVCPESGASQFWLVPEGTKRAYQLATAAFAASFGGRPDHHILLVEDGAGFHVPPVEGHPPGLETVTLPPDSPELQPVERAWNLTDEPLANRCLNHSLNSKKRLGNGAPGWKPNPISSRHTPCSTGVLSVRIHRSPYNPSPLRGTSL